MYINSFHSQFGPFHQIFMCYTLFQQIGKYEQNRYCFIYSVIVSLLQDRDFHDLQHNLTIFIHLTLHYNDLNTDKYEFIFS